MIDHLGLSIGLRMKSDAHLKLDPSELKEIVPNMPRNHWITITNNGHRETMKSDDALKEHPGNRSCGVWVTQRKKMRLLGESVNHC